MMTLAHQIYNNAKTTKPKDIVNHLEWLTQIGYCSIIDSYKSYDKKAHYIVLDDRSAFIIHKHKVFVIKLK